MQTVVRRMLYTPLFFSFLFLFYQQIIFNAKLHCLGSGGSSKETGVCLKLIVLNDCTISWNAW